MRPTVDQVLAAALVLLIAAVAPSVLLGSQGVRQLLALREQSDRLRMTAAVRARDNERLRGAIGKLKSDAVFLEGLARQELGLVRPGETVYRFRPPDAPDR